MKEKVKILHYKCKKCNFQKDFLSNEQINLKCKICGNEMEFDYSRNYNPSNGLKAIKNSNITMDTNTEFCVSKDPIIECPYCHATNVKKITATSKAVHTAVFGIFSMSRNSKQWHCNHCGADF